jgi:hypothetical protein
LAVRRPRTEIIGQTQKPEIGRHTMQTKGTRRLSLSGRETAPHRFRSKDVLLAELDDFLPGGWPPEVLERAEGLATRGEAGMRSFTRRALGSTSAAAKRRARYAVVELPVAAVISHVRADEPPPPVVDMLVADAYRALIPGR